MSFDIDTENKRLRLFFYNGKLDGDYRGRLSEFAHQEESCSVNGCVPNGSITSVCGGTDICAHNPHAIQGKCEEIHCHCVGDLSQEGPSNAPERKRRVLDDKRGSLTLIPRTEVMKCIFEYRGVLPSL